MSVVYRETRLLEKPIAQYLTEKPSILNKNLIVNLLILIPNTNTFIALVTSSGNQKKVKRKSELCQTEILHLICN